MKFTIKLPCSTWVYAYIKNNFGEPANFNSNAFLKNLIKNSIEKPRAYNRISKNIKYTKQIDLEISQFEFYQFGWELSEKAVIEINRIIELQLKALCLIFVAIKMSFGNSIKDCIFDFQKKMNFTDSDWNYHTIVKFLQRNLPKNDLKQNLDKFLINTIKNVKNKL